MVELLALAVAVLAGVDLRRVGLLAGLVLMPLITAGLVALVVWKKRQSKKNASAIFCEGVASELRAGSLLPEALGAAATSVGSRIDFQGAVSEGSTTAMARTLGQEFEDVGIELEMTIRAAARSGSKAADLFDEIGSVAIARSEIAHEVRIASSPAKATAVVFIAAPALFLLVQARSGALTSFLAFPEQRMAGSAGLTLFVLGIGIAALLMWRAR
jgi:Flp pilus assembly protein TadB